MVALILLGIATATIILKLMAGLAISWWIVTVLFLLALAAFLARVLWRAAFLFLAMMFVVELNNARRNKGR